MMALIRTLIFYVYYSVVTGVVGILAGIGYWFLPAKRVAPLVCCWSVLVVHGARILCGIRYVRHGNLPEPGKQYVIMSKHQSAWETFYLQMVCGRISTILKKELLRIPGFGWGLRVLQPVAIDRSNPLKALKQVKEQGMARIRSGRSLLVFPEGTRIAVGESGKYARSGAEIAVTTGVEVIPVAHNAGYCWINKRFIKKPGLITVVFGEPIKTEGKTSKQLTEEVKQWIDSQQAKIEPPPEQ